MVNGINLQAAQSAAMRAARASGRLDGFWENDVNAWDLCAGAVLVAAAGGRVTDASGHPYGLATRPIAATNGHLHPALLAELREEGSLEMAVVPSRSQEGSR